MASQDTEIPDLAGPPSVERSSATGDASAEQAPTADAVAPPPAVAPSPPVAPPPPPPATSHSSPWPDRLNAAAAEIFSWLSRPRVRLTVTGAVLLLVGGLFVTNSVWTLPLVIVGALMVVVAWVGRRIDGRLAIEWGETGTQLEFRAEIKAAPSGRPARALMSSRARELEGTAEDEPEDAEVVEGEAHTVEIEVAELKALIAAAETAEAVIAETDASAQATRNLRVATGGDGRG